MRQKSRGLGLVTLALIFSLASSSVAVAQIPSSSNYSVPESGFTSGSDINANSASYNARTSVGNLGIGQSESGSYIGLAGIITPDQEYAELIIPVSTINMGTLNPGTPGVGTATFSARTYLNDSYIIVSLRNPPTNESGRVIAAMTTMGAFSATTEQFGLNLVSNTSPATQGANPSRQPVDNGTFAFGIAATGYDTINNYKYSPGDVLARSVTRGYGETIYTISYILNVIPTTPAGLYRMEQDLVLTATF